MTTFDPNRYTQGQGQGQGGDTRTARERLRDLVDARTQSQQMLLGREEQARQRRAGEQKKKAREDTMRWGDDVAQGAGAGASFGPWGAAIGGIAGGIKGIAEATGARMGEGKKWYEALGTTLADFKGSAPSFRHGAPAAQSVGRAVSRDQARKQRMGEDPQATMEAIQARSSPPASSLGTLSASPDTDKFEFEDMPTGETMEFGGLGGQGAGDLTQAITGESPINPSSLVAGTPQAPDARSVSLGSPSDVQIGDPWDFEGQDLYGGGLFDTGELDPSAVDIYAADQPIESAAAPGQEYYAEAAETANPYGGGEALESIYTADPEDEDELLLSMYGP